MFGAIGEEMLFRGYAFQVLIGYLGPFATILPFGILFAFAHLGNPGQGSPVVGWIAPVNTALWGILLGYAFVRQRRPVAADRLAFRLELGASLAGREL